MNSSSTHFVRDEEDHFEEDYCDSAKYSPELDEEVPNEVTDTHNKPVCSTYDKHFGFHRTAGAVLCGGCGHIPGSFALCGGCGHIPGILLFFFAIIKILQLNSEKEYSSFNFSESFTKMHA